MKVQWLEDSDKENIEKETLEEQYKIVKKETNTSMVDNKALPSSSPSTASSSLSPASS